MGVRLPSPESGGTSGSVPRPKKPKASGTTRAGGSGQRSAPGGSGVPWYERNFQDPATEARQRKGQKRWADNLHDMISWSTAASGRDGSGSGSGDGGFGAWLAGQTDSTNQMYDQMLGILGKQVGGGRLAINAAQRDLTNELRDLGRESTRTHRDVSRQIGRRGSQSLADLERALGTEQADLGRSGADLKALLAEGLNSRTALRSAGDRRSTVNDRLAQLMGDDIGNYQRFGETNKAGYTQALSSAEALQRAQLEMQRTQALQALQASGGGGGFGGGGGGSGSSDKPIDWLAASKKGQSDLDSLTSNAYDNSFQKPNIGQYYDELNKIGDEQYRGSVRQVLEMALRQDDPSFLLNQINDPANATGLDGKPWADEDYNVAWGLANMYKNFGDEQVFRRDTRNDAVDDGRLNQSPSRKPQRGLKNMIRSILGG